MVDGENEGGKRRLQSILRRFPLFGGIEFLVLRISSEVIPVSAHERLSLHF